MKRVKTFLWNLFKVTLLVIVVMATVALAVALFEGYIPMDVIFA